MQAERWVEALARTRRTAFGRLASLLGATELKPGFWQALEASLIQADLGVRISDEILVALKDLAASQGLTRGEQLQDRLRELLVQRLQSQPCTEIDAKPRITLLIGVNGSGKTTAAARLARRWQKSGSQVLLAAADTYRAAAGEQLASWAERLGVELIRGQPGSDPGAVIFNACQAALSRGIEVVIGDTSGRMHTSHNLMAELQKVAKVAGKAIPGAPHEVFLVMDATTGQNGLSQAKAFHQVMDVTGVILAKLDSSARGGIALAVVQELGLPICYVGVGEDLDDLEVFDAELFVDGLLENPHAEAA